VKQLTMLGATNPLDTTSP